MSLNIIAAATRNYVKRCTLIFSEFPKLSRFLCKHFHLISTYMAQRWELQPLFHHSQQYFYNVLEAVAVRKFVVSYASTSFFIDKCWPSLLAPASSGSGSEILSKWSHLLQEVLNLFVYNIGEGKSSNSTSLTFIYWPFPGLKMQFPLLMSASVPSGVLVASCMLTNNPAFPFQLNLLKKSHLFTAFC